MTRRTILPALLIASLGALSSCGAARSQSPAQLQAPPDAAACVALARQHLHAGRTVEAIAVANQARTRHVLTPALQVVEIRALWQSGQGPLAQQRERELGETAAAQGHSSAAGQALIEVARYHQQQRKQPADVLRALAPLLPGGCRGRAVCRLAADALAALPPDAGLAAQIAHAAPAPAQGPGEPDRTPWLVGVVSELAKAQRIEDAEAVLATAIAQTPGEAIWWRMRFDLARRHPGPQARATWLAQVAQGHLPCRTLVEIATGAELEVDRAMALQVLTLAVAQPDADEEAWQLLAQAAARSEDRATLARMAAEAAARAPSRLTRLTLARSLLRLGQKELAAPIVKTLRSEDPSDDLAQVLESDLLRQQGQLAPARSRAEAALAAARDRSLVALLLSQTWRRALPVDADRWLTLASSQPGTGQLAAARQRCERELGAARPSPMAAQAVTDYARLLAHAPARPAPQPLFDDIEPSPAAARLWLVHQVEARGPLWQETYAGVVQVLADAGVAPPELMRDLALRALQDGDAEKFLTLDARARAAAQTQGSPLEPDRIVRELLARSVALLPRWLQQSGTEDVSDVAMAWRVAHALLTNQRAMAGRQWAQKAWQRSGSADVPVQVLPTLASNGAADIALEVVAGTNKSGDLQQDLAYLLVEISALLAADRPQQARDQILALAQRPDLPIKLLRAVVEIAGDAGMCDVVVRLSPRLVADADVYAWRAGITRGVECARRLQDTEVVRALRTSAEQGQADPQKLDLLARELATHGFEASAVELFEILARTRATPEDALTQWARALLVLHREAEAAQVLHNLVTMVRSRSPRAYLRAAELLEDYGQLGLAWSFLTSAVALDPDNAVLRLRLVVNAMRAKRTEGLIGHVQALLKTGPGAEEIKVLLGTADRTGNVRLLYDAAAGIPDPDRELERFRMELAAVLGDRDAVNAGVRALRAKGPVQTARVPEWLAAVGAQREAREVSEDILAAPEPAGAAFQRQRTLGFALENRRDPSSTAQALSLARLYTGRALDTERAALEAALELSRLGLAKEAQSVATLAGKSDNPLRMCLSAQLEADAGRRDQARALLHRAMASVLLDPRLRDWLRSFTPSPVREDAEDLYAQSQCIIGRMADAGDYGDLSAWLQELQQIAPDSAQVRAKLVQVQLMDGRVEEAAAGLRDAARSLPSLARDDFEPLFERVARDGGLPLLRAWLGEEGSMLRTEPWMLAFAQTIVPEAPKAASKDSADGLEPVRDLLRELPSWLPGARTALSMAASAQGQGQRAARLLGQGPLAVAEVARGEATRAMAAAAIAHLGETGTTAKAADDAVDRWLSQSGGAEAVAALMAELTRQGHPQLAASLASRHKPLQFTGVWFQTQRQLLLAGIGTLSDEALAEAAMQLLRGQRSNLETFDDVLDRLLQSGRIDASRRLSERMAREEPGILPPGILDDKAADDDVAGLSRLIGAYHPRAVTALRRTLPALPHDLGEDAQALAVAADPTLALAWTTQLAASQDEAWRPWWSLYGHAVNFERADLAQSAWKHAEEAGAPKGVLACSGLWLRRTGTLQACLRDRPVESLADPELGDLALAVALDVDAPAQGSLRAALLAAPSRTEGRFAAAAASRLWVLDAQGRARLAAFVRDLHDGLEPMARRTAFAITAMDDLAELGLGQLGLNNTLEAWTRHPEGQGQRNNLAYARFLSGQDAAEILTLARPAEFASGGEAAYAALDTLAALHWASGDHSGAVALQWRALAAAVATQRDNQAGLGLPTARLAEFLLQTGHSAEARTLAVLALHRPDDSGSQRRARRVLRACLQSAP